jgi:glycosyltransferase involved in cell wall biosynthesis
MNNLFMETKKLKICYILSHFTQGGAERQILNLITGLDKNKFEPTLLIYSCPEFFYNDINKTDVRIITYDHHHKPLLIRNIYNVITLFLFLRKQHFDILHTALYHNGFFVRLFAGKKYRNKIIYSIRDNFDIAPAFYKFFEKMFVKSSWVVTNSLNAKNNFLKQVGEKYTNKVVNIYNGFDIQKFEINRASNPDFVIGNIGRHIFEKNQLQLLKAFNKLTLSDNANLYIIGNKTTEVTPFLNAYVKENKLENSVSILDSQPDIVEYYRRFEIFVLTSLSEGFPNVIFEAMLSGCICIISESANSDNLIVDGVNGFVYNGTETMLLSKIVKAHALKGTPQANKIIIEGKKYVKDNFSNQVMVEKYIQLYNKLIS